MFDDATQTNNDQSAQPAQSAPAVVPDAPVAAPTLPSTNDPVSAPAEPAIVPDPTMSSAPIAPEPATDISEPSMPSEPTFNTTPVAADLPNTDANEMPSLDNTAPSDDLMDIKKQALQSLAPLVGKLDQSPEEKFRTTMMMIQASDDQSMLKDAFEAAQNISDDKMRAQALLDVINEVNYFTQKNKTVN